MQALAQEITVDTSRPSVGVDSISGNLGGGNLGHSGNLDMLTLFLHADMVVKLVMILLTLASVYCWVIIIRKYRLMKRLDSRSRRFHKLLRAADDWQSLYAKIGVPRDPLSAVFAALSEEALRRQSEGGKHDESLMGTIVRPFSSITEITIRRQSDLLERGLGFLATTASAAPFIGLFGTVWGIMNSFSSIAASNQTSLAVVAPGIAEALFATALGLVAAIPATIAYNKFNDDIGRYMSDVENFAYQFGLSLENSDFD